MGLNTHSDEGGAASPLACSTQNLSVAYHADPVLLNVDFRVPTGIIMGIIGPNGAGKSTLIKAMLGLVKPLAGSCEFFGQPLSAVRKRIGYMPQSNSVDWDFPTSVLDVATMGTYGDLGWFRRPGKKERDRAMAALEQTGIADLAARPIGELSGGQRQRAFLARTLAQNPDIFFMDEPFQGIDAKSQQAIISVLHTLREQGKTVVFVHHDLSNVRNYCDYVTLLNRTIIDSGPVDSCFTADNVHSAYEMASGSPFLFEVAS
ncbi:MAG: metal ABC transporter ATP-binding protein [Actinomycetaceae bacterium]|nr:metal ABC transporter ATP-binding protein [Actinomycetaceae bacterium]